MTQAQIDALPPHMKGIRFENHHFYENKKAKGNDQKLLLKDTFIDEVMLLKGLHFVPEITRVIPFGESQLYVEAKVTVYQRYEINGKKDDKQTTAFASMTKIPHAEGQTHFAQMCITRALKTAVLRQLNLSDNDIILAIEAFEINLKAVRSIARNVIDVDDSYEEKEPAIIEPEVDANLSLDDLV